MPSVTFKKIDIYRRAEDAQRPLWAFDANKPLSPADLKTILAKARQKDPRQIGGRDIGAAGAAVIKEAYDKAKAKAGGNPTRLQVQAEIDKASSALQNERKAGRVNDGYIDSREGAAEGKANSVAAKLYEFATLEKSTAAPVGPNIKATEAQIAKALKTLLPVAEAGYKLIRANPTKYEDNLGAAFREASKKAGLTAEAQALLMTAVNGSMPRGDNGTWEAGNLADLKKILTNAQAKLKSVDGALIVDFNNPNKKPTSKKDGIITSQELDRTAAATGKTAVALLKYASSL